jgi:hypothetical protein
VLAIEDPAVWETLSNGLDQGRFVSTDRCAIVARLRQIDPEMLRDAAQRRIDGAAAQPNPVTEAEYRRAEYDAFREGRGDANTDLAVDVRSGDEYDAPVRALVLGVGLIRKLRETRALAGFTRILPPSTFDDTQDASAMARDSIQPLALGRGLGWLPAIVVRGEGIFIEFRADVLDEWTSRRTPGRRIESMVRAYNRRRTERLLPPRYLPPRFVLLHTLAHVLIRQLSFECGYGSASLRERIYCEDRPDGQRMNGILIYTASGDSEGTMGGLVRQGEPGRLELTFAEGIRTAGWCSSDPVCIESTGQGADNANLAACHGCVLLSETSCEEGNRLLDRAMLTGTLTDRRSVALSPVDGRHVPGNRQAPQNSCWTSRASSEQGDDLAAPRVHQ